ncbi:hypothetical protein [Erythrobacter sp.]|uniref:hypothetical protein n=1 Tax=Erythrobacter sp. TaxID=1042 RepID=UPI001425FA6D|nr:hypothetical protein [Erythrobacter sp.]QIQ86986.1 MAG: hypothetical protein G9473_10020 [Erythrobacter sp.]
MAKNGAGQPMKLDMGRAWNDAMGLLSANFAVIATVLGLFYFLPQFAIALFAPDASATAAPDLPPDASPEMVMEALNETFSAAYADIWPYILLTAVLGYVGALAVLALLRREGNPTVGEALKAGIIGTPSYFATQLLFGLGAGLFIVLPVALVGAIAPIAAVLVGLLLVVVLVYAAFKLLLVPAVIGIEGDLNPFAVMARSWRLTKGNTLRIFTFVVLLFVVLIIVTIIVSLVAGLIFAAMGDEAVRIGGGFISALTNAAVGAIYLTVIAAIHRQLSGDRERVIETFE